MSSIRANFDLNVQGRSSEDTGGDEGESDNFFHDGLLLGALVWGCFIPSHYRKGNTNLFKSGIAGTYLKSAAPAKLP